MVKKPLVEDIIEILRCKPEEMMVD